MRLSGDSPYQGRVEICRGSVWGSVCFSSSFSNNDATVICRMLGYQPDHIIGEITERFSVYNLKIGNYLPAFLLDALVILGV